MKEKYVVSIVVYRVWGPEDEEEWDLEDMETLAECDSYDEAKEKMDTFPWLRYPSDGTGIPST